MEINVLEWIGYIASVIVAVSLAMTSIVKFRWVNLIGAATFSIYGFLIGALPVGFLNGFIAIIDIYFLYTIYSKKEVFETNETSKEFVYAGGDIVTGSATVIEAMGAGRIAARAMHAKLTKIREGKKKKVKKAVEKV